MNISNGARKLLEGKLKDELDAEGAVTSVSDRKGGICVTRVFRFGGGADEWVRSIREECMTPDGGEITIGEMWVPDPARGDQSTLVIAATAPGIALKGEPEVRKGRSPGGVRVAEIPGPPASIEVSRQSDLLGFIRGRVSYDGRRWEARINGQRPSALVAEKGLLDNRTFSSPKEALQAIDRLVDDWEGREVERRREEQKVNEHARSEIDSIFDNGLIQGGNER